MVEGGEMNKEYERVRTEAIKRTKDILDLPPDVFNISQCTNRIVARILSIKGIAILSDDQSLHSLKGTVKADYLRAYGEGAYLEGWEHAQQDMLKVGFVKVVKGD